MNVLGLPKFTVDENESRASDGFDFLEEDSEVPELVGELHFSVRVGQDLVIYTESRVDRPWIGRVTRIFPERRQFEIHWMSRVGKSDRYLLLYNNDQPSLDILDEDMVMFSDMRHLVIILKCEVLIRLFSRHWRLFTLRTKLPLQNIGTLFAVTTGCN